VAVGARGSGMENHSRVIFGALGMSFDDIRPVYLGFGPGSQAVREGKADAQLQCCLPNTPMTRLSELTEVRAVNMDAHLDMIMEVGGTYGRTTLARGAFKGHDQDMASLSILQGWMASPKLEEETAYIFAKVFLENIDDMVKKTPLYEAVQPMLAEAREKNSLEPVEIGAPMHPGAARAFKEAGIIR